ASAILSIVGSFFMIWGWYGEVLPFWAFLSGVVVGMAIGFVAEYYTSGEQVEELAQFCRTGAATNIIQGMGLSYRSTVIPLVLFDCSVQAAGLDEIEIVDANVVADVFIGGIVPFLFAGDAMRAGGRADCGVVEEVRRLFKEIHGLVGGSAGAVFARYVDITT